MNIFRKHSSFENWYFETSAVNSLLDNIFSKPENSSIKTRKLELKKGRKWYISNITLWEMFLTNNEDRRTELFDFSRCIFYKDLMPSIEELLINYINNGLPIIEKRYKLKSFSLFGKEWTKACRNINYFFAPDIDTLKKHTEYYRFFGEYFVKTNNGYSLNFNENISVADKDVDMKKIESAFQTYTKTLSNDWFKKNEKYIYVSFKLVLIIFCYGINFDQKTTEKYWKKKRVENPIDRINYVVENIPNIFTRGPIANISKMILLQANTKSTRGVYFDALHSIYITYSDLYFSDDEHFGNLKQINDPNMMKIKKTTDLINNNS